VYEAAYNLANLKAYGDEAIEGVAKSNYFLMSDEVGMGCEFAFRSTN
jgi:hypothetical protein